MCIKTEDVQAMHVSHCGQHLRQHVFLNRECNPILTNICMYVHICMLMPNYWIEFNMIHQPDLTRKYYIL